MNSVEKASDRLITALRPIDRHNAVARARARWPYFNYICHFYRSSHRILILFEIAGQK